MFSDSDGGMNDGVDKCALVEALLLCLPVWLGAIDLARRQLPCNSSYNSRVSHEELSVLASLGDE